MLLSDGDVVRDLRGAEDGVSHVAIQLHRRGIIDCVHRHVRSQFAALRCPVQALGRELEAIRE